MYSSLPVELHPKKYLIRNKKFKASSQSNTIEIMFHDVCVVYAPLTTLTEMRKKVN